MKNAVYTFLFSALLAGCATVSKNTVDMSTTLSTQLDVLETSHLSTVTLLIDQKKRDAQDYLDNHWYPVYLDSLFKEKSVVDMWQKAFEEQNTDSRLTIIKAITKVAQEQYANRYTTLFDSIAKSEQQLTDAIRLEYQKAKELGSAINTNLSSAYELEKLTKNIIEDVAQPLHLGTFVSSAFNRIDSAYVHILNLVDVYEKDKDKLSDLLKDFK